MADAETIMGETGVIYVCAECGEPVESEPCREHQHGQYLTMYLASAKPGARCKAPGFTDWVKTPYNGWVQDETGWHVSDGFLGNMLAENGYRLEFEPSPASPDSSDDARGIADGRALGVIQPDDPASPDSGASS